MDYPNPTANRGGQRLDATVQWITDGAGNLSFQYLGASGSTGWYVWNSRTSLHLYVDGVRVKYSERFNVGGYPGAVIPSLGMVTDLLAGLIAALGSYPLPQGGNIILAYGADSAAPTAQYRNAFPTWGQSYGDQSVTPIPAADYRPGQRMLNAVGQSLNRSGGVCQRLVGGTAVEMRTNNGGVATDDPPWRRSGNVNYNQRKIGGGAATPVIAVDIPAWDAGVHQSSSLPYQATQVITVTNTSAAATSGPVSISVDKFPQYFSVNKTSLPALAGGASNTFAITINIPAGTPADGYLGTISLSGTGFSIVQVVPFFVIVSGLTNLITDPNLTSIGAFTYAIPTLAWSVASNTATCNPGGAGSWQFASSFQLTPKKGTCKLTIPIRVQNVSSLITQRICLRITKRQYDTPPTFRLLESGSAVVAGTMSYDPVPSPTPDSDGTTTIGWYIADLPASQLARLNMAIEFTIIDSVEIEEPELNIPTTDTFLLYRGARLTLE